MRRTLIALALTLAAASAHAAPPDLLRPPPRRNRRLIIAGAVLLGIGYLVSLGLAIRYEEGELAAPMLGPLVDLRRCAGCAGSPVGQAEIGGLVLDSMLQAAGGALLTIGSTPRRSGSSSVSIGPNGALVVF